jgi:signal transduction histidine kinase
VERSLKKESGDKRREQCCLAVSLRAVVTFSLAKGDCHMYRIDELTKRKLDYQKQIAVAVVHSSAIGLGAVLNNYPGEAERTHFIQTYAAPIRFYSDESGYFFIFTFDGLSIVHANQRELEGQNMYNIKDTKGNYLVRKMCDVAQRGGGFVEYYWVKPGSESVEEQRKLGYVEPIPGTNYFIGAGVYMGD